MDAITSFAFNLNNGFLITLSRIIDNNIIFLLIIAALIFLTEKRNPKRVKIFSAIILATVIVIILKSFTAVERPCASLVLDYCPADYAFPSLHATIAFLLMISFLNKRCFWIYMIFAIFVCFTRLVIGVHSFYDIAAALPVALIVYYFVDVLWRRLHE